MYFPRVCGYAGHYANIMSVQDGKLPLEVATTSGHVSVVRLLLEEAGYNVDNAMSVSFGHTRRMNKTPDRTSHNI